MTEEPLDLAAIDRHDRMWDDPENVYNAQYAMEERRALLAEVKRLRAHLDDDRISRSEYAERTGICPDCGQPTQPEETP